MQSAAIQRAFSTKGEDLLPHPYKCNPAVCQMTEGKETATQMEFSVFAKIRHEHNLAT